MTKAVFVRYIILSKPLSTPLTTLLKSGGRGWGDVHLPFSLHILSPFLVESCQAVRCAIHVMWCKVRRKKKNFQYDRYELGFFYSFTCCFCLFFFSEIQWDGVFFILGDPGAVSRVGRKGATKVFKYGRKSPRVPTLTELFPKIQADAGSWLGTKSALYFSAQSANSSPWVLFMSSYTTVIVLPYLPGSFTKLVRARETFIFYFS